MTHKASGSGPTDRNPLARYLVASTTRGKPMRRALITLWLLLGSSSPALAQLSLAFAVQGVTIGINVPVYPELRRVPGYPVYYAPGINSNYFFYDGLYWVYDGQNWYASSWYGGPWALVDPLDVPVFLLRVPVRYYRHPPAFFHGWREDDAPRWGEHWGPSWEKRRNGWDRWNRGSAPAPAPLPTYQRQYSGNRYPQPSQQAALEQRNYHYQPKDAVAQQHFRPAMTQSPAAQAQPRAQRAAQPQQAKHKPQPAPAHEQRASNPQPRQQQAERKPPQVQAAHEQQAPKPQPHPAARPQQVKHKPQPAPAREQRASNPQPRQQQAERKPPQVQAAHGQQAPKPQPHPAARPQQVKHKPQPAPAREQRASNPQPHQHQAEREPPQMQATREPQGPRAKAKDRGNEQGHEEGHDNK